MKKSHTLIHLFILQVMFFSCAKTENITEIKNDEVYQTQDQPLTEALQAHPGSMVITSDWLLNYPMLTWDASNLRWLDNENLIYSTPPVIAGNEQTIELINIESGKRLTLGAGSNPKASPDKKWIAFVKGQNEHRQLWIMDSSGADLHQVSNIKEGVFPSDFFTDYVWSPDSKRLAILYKINYNYEIPDKVTPPSIIDLIDVTTGQSKHLGSFDARIRDLSWIGNTNDILFTKERMGFQYKDNVNYEMIVALNTDNGQLRTLAKFDGWQQDLSPVASPDGTQISFLYDPESPIFDVTQSIGLIKNDGISSKDKPDIMRLTKDMKFHNHQWSPDGQFLFASRIYGAYRHVYALELKTGKIKQITNGPFSIENYSISPDGEHIAWIDFNAHSLRNLKVANNKGEKIKNLFTLTGVPSEMALSEVREITWNTADYPIPMRGLLFLPLNYEKGKKYPLVVDIHGGGRSASLSIQSGGGLLTTTPLEWQLWSAKNYAVFVPEFRSSGAFGSLAMTRDFLQNHDLLFGDLRDIEAGVDYLIDQGIADPAHLAVIGMSAGARRANLLTTISHKFNAIVSREGWADDYIGAINSLYGEMFYPEMGGSPWDVPDIYLKDSALTHAFGATTPTLFLMGNPKLGGVDPYDTVSILHNLLKAQNVNTEHVKYSDEGHGLTKQVNRKDALERALNWIEMYIEHK